MARGTTLANLRTMLKAEIGENSGTNTLRDAELNTLLSNKQKVLATEHYWPFLTQHWDVTITAGQQFIALPTALANDPATGNANMDLDQLPTVQVYYSTVYRPVIYGIDEVEYRTFDYMKRGNKSDPIQRWRLCTNPNEPNNANKFEVWPVPNTDQILRFTRERALQNLVQDSDTADLDDLLIVLFVAADICTRKKLADAQLKLQQANRRLQWLRQGYTEKDVRRCMDGQGDADWRQRRKLVGIRIAVA